MTQYIERMGIGTGDMIRRCRDAGLKEPEFRISDGFVLAIWRPKDASVTGNMSGITSGKTSGKIVDLMRQRRDITIPEIAEILGKTPRAIEMQVNKLKAEAVIGRVGPAKGGHWEVVESTKG
mgnify:CR=1 FL=1